MNAVYDNKAFHDWFIRQVSLSNKQEYNYWLDKFPAVFAEATYPTPSLVDLCINKIGEDKDSYKIDDLPEDLRNCITYAPLQFLP
jgi:hypothetical protein